MTYDRSYFRVVGLALLPALGVSVAVVLTGQLLQVSETAAERISQILFFPIFLGACTWLRNRRR